MMQTPVQLCINKLTGGITMKKEERQYGIATELLHDLAKDKNFLIKALFISLIVNVIAVMWILRK